MVPSSFVVHDELPRTSSGKIDRQALARDRRLDGGASHAYVAPSGESENRVAAVWRDVLQVERVGANDNFFDLGGDSLLITQVRSRLHSAFGGQMTIVELFRYPTVRSLARHLDEQAAKAAAVLDLLESLSDAEASALLSEDGTAPGGDGAPEDAA
jgi:polyketide synthase PksJ